MSLPATYTFPGPAGIVDIPPWTNVTNVYTLDKDGANHGLISFPGQDGYDYWAADTLPNDQYAQIEWGFTPTVAGDDYVYLFLRGVYASNIIQTGYWFWSDGLSDTAILRVDSGTPTSLSTAPATTFVSGDVMTAQAVGNGLTLLKNGIAVVTATDSTYTSGQPGLGGFTVDNALLVENWETDAASGGGGHPGLTGTGSIPVTSPAGLSISIADIPFGLGQGAGNPTDYYRLGSVSFADGNGAVRNYFLSHQLELVVAPFPNATIVYYQFTPGVTAEIQELSVL